MADMPLALLLFVPLFAMKLKELILPPLSPVVVVVFGALLVVLVSPRRLANGST